MSLSELSDIVLRTPKSQAISKMNTPPPTLIFGFIELINPGRLGGTDISSARAARQFYGKVDFVKISEGDG